MPDHSDRGTAVVAEAPGNIKLKALTSLVRSRMSKGQFLEALPIIEKAREIAPADVRLRLSLDSVWRRLSMDVATRVALMADTLELQADSPVVKFQLARALIDSGDEVQLSRAKVLLEDIISERPDMSRAHLLYASLLRGSEPERSRVHRETAARLEHKHHRANAANHLMRRRYWTLSALAVALMVTLAVVLLPQLLQAPGFDESVEPRNLVVQSRVENIRREEDDRRADPPIEGEQIAVAAISERKERPTSENRVLEKITPAAVTTLPRSQVDDRQKNEAVASTDKVDASALKRESDALAQALSSKLTAMEQDLAAALTSKDTSAKTAETRISELSSKLTAMEKDLAAALTSKDTSAKAAETRIAELSSKLTAMEKDLAAALTSKDTSAKAAETRIAELSSKLTAMEKDLAAALTSKDTSAKAAETKIAELSSELMRAAKELAAALASKDTSAKTAETKVAELSSKLAALGKKLTAMRAARAPGLPLKASTLRLDWELR